MDGLGLIPVESFLTDGVERDPSLMYKAQPECFMISQQLVRRRRHYVLAIAPWLAMPVLATTVAQATDDAAHTTGADGTDGAASPGNNGQDAPDAFGGYRNFTVSAIGGGGATSGGNGGDATAFGGYQVNAQRR